MASKHLGDFTLLKQVGEGSLGTLYAAEHRFLRKSFALKVLPEELVEDKAFLQRFEKDVHQLASLEHPHLVKVHNVSSAEGLYFLVADSLEGSTSLAEYAQGKQLSEEEVLKILEPVASALDYAHQKSLAHLCLKLNNILLSKENNVAVADFGLSRIVGMNYVLNRVIKNMADSTRFFQDYAFLAPEQKKGVAADAKADIYAFGVLAYYLLMGAFPEGAFEMPLEKRSDLKYNWDELISQCLKVDPSKRPSSLQEALNTLKEEISISVCEEEPQPLLQPQEIKRPEFEPDPGAIFQAETTVVRYQPEPQEDKVVEPLLTKMVVIRAGSYARGCNSGARDEMPRHEVTVASFAMDVHPVTNEQFVRFLEAMGGEKDANNNDIIRLKEARIKRASGKLSIETGYAKHPVVGVTWYGAIAYAKWVGKRLPTEAEWEIAATGGQEETIYPVGADIERSHANFFSSDTTAVMSYPPNPIGLYDMAGNVYEWCQDWYGYHYYDVSVQEPNNPKGPLQGVYRVLRGGCWKSLKEDLRCSHRHRNNPGTVNGTYGFRCAADVS